MSGKPYTCGIEDIEFVSVVFFMVHPVSFKLIQDGSKGMQHLRSSVYSTGYAKCLDRTLFFLHNYEMIIDWGVHV